MSLQTGFFSDLYLKFTQVYTRTRVEEKEEPRVPEKVIRCVWNDQLFNTQDLRTLDGRPLEVIFPGYWNFGSGPDFKSAAIRVDGQLHEGDVELHVFGTDWKAHRHSKNNDYDNVILHVFLWQGRGIHSLDPEKETRSGKQYSRPHIFELELKSYLRQGVLQLNEQLDFDSYPLLNQFNHGLCHRPLARLSDEKFTQLLEQAGDARVQTKMDRFHDRVIMKGYEQTFYEGVAEALGYPSNKLPFRTLAERLPLSDLKTRVPKRATNAERALHLQAILYGVSGLLDFSALDHVRLTREDAAYFDTLERLWKRYSADLAERKMDRAEWKFGHMRPANFPYRRIAGLSHLLARHWESGLFAACLDALRKIAVPADDPREERKHLKWFFAFFCLEAMDYWAAHYTPGGKQLKQNQQLVGPDRSREIVINIVLPIGLIYARASRSVPLEAALGRLYSARHPVADNKWIRFMRTYILGNKERLVKLLTNDRRTQGLMQVYQDFCTKNQNNCLRCKFPGVVDRYFS